MNAEEKSFKKKKRGGRGGEGRGEYKREFLKLLNKK
jgi:hypothetical protein